MKNFLPTPKSFISTLMIVNLFLFSSITSFAATKTWNGGSGGGPYNWNTPGNWMGGVAPIAGDDIVFGTAGTITFSIMPASVSYNSLWIQSGALVNLVAAAGMTMTIGGGTPDPDFFIDGTSALAIGANVNITMASGANANISGSFIINSGRTFNNDGTSVVTNVFGTITSVGTVTCNSASKLLFQSGGAYVHSQNGGTIPTATWDVNSICSITGFSNTHPSGGNQTFGNLTYNCSSMTVNVTMPNGLSVARDFTVISTPSTGTGRLQMTAGSLNVGRDLDIEYDFTIANSTNRTLTVGRDAFISGGGNIDFCNSNSANVGTLIVGGNFTSFGTMKVSGTGASGAISFNGSNPQNFNQSGNLLDLINFTINNTGGGTGVTFSNSTTLNGSLTLTNGILTIPATTTLTIANGNVIGGSGFGSAKHINTQETGANTGVLTINKIAVATPYLFPVGDGTNYLPVTLSSANTLANNTFSVSAFNGITTDGSPAGPAFTPAQKDKCVDAVWIVNYNGAGSPVAPLPVSMTLGWPAALEGTSFSLFTTLLIGIGHWDNPNWGNCSGSGDNSLNTATRTGITSFSPFGVGKTPYVLPIKFSYLNAAKGNGYNTLNWKAACSSSEVTFSIERSTDGANFTAINSINANQTRCNQPFDYVDNISLTGTVFYRIKSTEITGLVTYSTIVKLTDQQKDMQLTAVLPNPVINQAQLSISTAKKDMVDLVIISMEGKVMQRNSVQVQAGSSIINLDVANLQKGVYIIRGAFSNGQTSTIRFTKQ